MQLPACQKTSLVFQRERFFFCTNRACTAKKRKKNVIKKLGPLKHYNGSKEVIDEAVMLTTASLSLREVRKTIAPATTTTTPPRPTDL